MLSRRRFLAYGSTGMLALSTGCKPHHLNWLAEPNSTDAPLSLSNKAEIAHLKERFLGYPINMKTPPQAFFDWREQLYKVGINQFPYNNVGDPFKDSPIPYNSHDFEKTLIERFAVHYGFPQNNRWGFLSHSGTDSNMHGMYMGRTILKGRTGKTPKAYFTREAHYSVQILRDLLGLEGIEVDTLDSGAMDPQDLADKLAQHTAQPALVILTLGTTFRGAIDPIDDIQAILSDYSSYLHLDAALFGGYLPYTAHAQTALQQTTSGKIRYDSIAVSCHKFFGFVSPAGLFITRQSHFEEFHDLFSQIHNPEYIHHVPGTITCSRDAVKPAEFYFYSSDESIAQIKTDAKQVLLQTDWLMKQLQYHFPEYLATRANPLSNTIYFRKPAERLINKYSLATMQLTRKQKKLDFAHVVIMPHVSNAILNEFLTDLSDQKNLS